MLITWNFLYIDNKVKWDAGGCDEEFDGFGEIGLPDIY